MKAIKDTLSSKSERNTMQNNQVIPSLIGFILQVIISKYQKTGEDEFREFSVERHNNFIENCVPSHHLKYFQNNYHDIVKAIPKKTIYVHNIISKVADVGLVRKYFSRDNYITIRPECHIIRPTNQEQVLITHKRQPKLAKSHFQSTQKVLRRLTALFRDTIACYSHL